MHVSYSTCRQCRNATIALANNSGLPGHALSRNCLCYLLCMYLGIALFPGSPPTRTETLFHTASDIMLEGAWLHCQHVMLIDSHLPTLYYCHLLGYGGIQTPGKPYDRLSTKHFLLSWTSKLLTLLFMYGLRTPTLRIILLLGTILGKQQKPTRVTVRTSVIPSVKLRVFL